MRKIIMMRCSMDMIFMDIFNVKIKFVQNLLYELLRKIYRNYKDNVYRNRITEIIQNVFNRLQTFNFSMFELTSTYFKGHSLGVNIMAQQWKIECLDKGTTVISFKLKLIIVDSADVVLIAIIWFCLFLFCCFILVISGH